MTLFILLLGLVLPTALGWIALVLLEGRTPVLTRSERLVTAVVLGPTLFALIAFVSSEIGFTRFTLPGFLLPNAVALCALTLLSVRHGAFATSLRPSAISLPAGEPVRPVLRIGIGLLALFTAVTIALGAIDLIAMPTYPDDAFNNWNMRGKIIALTGALPLSLPAQYSVTDYVSSVNAYPPMAPLLKAWLSTIRGSWNDGQANSVQLVWFLGLLGSFYLSLRRFVPGNASLLGTCLLAGMPLLLIQGMNSYADVFLASHLFLASVFLLHAARAATGEAAGTWLRLFAGALGLLLLTKNEALLLYAPVLLCLCLWVLLLRARQWGIRELRQLFPVIAIAALLVLPWLAFKWTHDLPFGNRREATQLSLSLNQQAVTAIWYHLSHEPNWLLLPLAVLAALALEGKKLLSSPVGIPLVIALLCFILQCALYVFVGEMAEAAIMQTGISRGFLHIAPLALFPVLLVFLPSSEMRND